MKYRPELACALFGLFLITVGIGWVSCGSGSAGVTVTISNRSGTDVTNLLVSFTGGSNCLAHLKPSKTFAMTVNPSGESDLVVEFSDSSGKRHSERIDVYLERNYRGAIHITIQPEGKVTWQDETKI